ncbi:MAG: DUF4352 domain-containing protein [Lachnospiraceae bacterium]|nr:DUF4352 domain-containing protein [Lachnospiraceae bacterium]
MKKFLAAILTGIMLLSIAGCGKTGIQNAGDDSWVDADDDVEVYNYDDGTKLYEGKIGSKMQTAWFDFTVNSAYYTEDAIGGYTPSDGNVLVVVNITVKNTFQETIPMFDTDFQLQWGDDVDDAYAFPVATNEKILSDQLPEEYDLKVKETQTGVLVFEAPAGNEDFSLSFLEYYEDNTEGNLFFVYFTADEK